MRRAILALLLLALGGLAVWALLPQPVAVDTATIRRQTLEISVEEEGVAKIREVFVVSATITGKLQRIGLHPGDLVQAGQTVVAQIGPVAPALLDDRARAVAEASVAAAEAAVGLARAQVAQAEATLAFRTSEATRARALFERATLAQHQLDLALLEQQTARAALDSALSTLSVRERELDSARAVLEIAGSSGTPSCCIALTAPVSGQVLRVLTEDEQVVQPGTPLIEIGDHSNMAVTVELLSRQAVQVQPGAHAEISGWGGPTLNAEVEHVEPAAVTRVSALGIDEQRVEVRLRLTSDPSEWQALGHGYRVVARIVVSRTEDVPAVPVGALFRDGSDWATFVVRDGKADLRRITLGARNDTAAEITAGLQEGDLVILHPSDLVADGVAVAPRPLP